MHTSRFAGLIAVSTVCLLFLAGSAPAFAASQPSTARVGGQLAELSGSGTAAGDQFGFSVAVSGATALVGADGHSNDAGEADVLTKGPSGWHQVATLKGSDTAAGDEFGSAVGISGTTAIVGAGDHAGHTGRAYVFTEVATHWKQVAELSGSDTAAGDYFGWSVGISGTTAVVGVYGHAKDAGRAYVFTKEPSGWKQVAELKGANTTAGDQFGSTVAISATTAVIAANARAGAAGRAYVFTKTATGWKQAVMLKGADTVAGDHFGWSVASSGTTAVVGSFHHAGLAGRAYVFTKTGAGWKQAAELKGSDTVAGDGFGISVATSGATAVVGATGHAGSAGRAYVFTNGASGWKQVAELKGADTVAGAELGFSVAISGTNALVGAPATKSHGRVYVFDA